jgi:hypothetical protein
MPRLKIFSCLPFLYLACFCNFPACFYNFPGLPWQLSLARLCNCPCLCSFPCLPLLLCMSAFTTLLLACLCNSSFCLLYIIPCPQVAYSFPALCNVPCLHLPLSLHALILQLSLPVFVPFLASLWYFLTCLCYDSDLLPLKPSLPLFALSFRPAFAHFFAFTISLPALAPYFLDWLCSYYPCLPLHLNLPAYATFPAYLCYYYYPSLPFAQDKTNTKTKTRPIPRPSQTNKDEHTKNTKKNKKLVIIK